jgi:DNA-directed RNA polymerase subunit F
MEQTAANDQPLENLSPSKQIANLTGQLRTQPSNTPPPIKETKQLVELLIKHKLIYVLRLFGNQGLIPISSNRDIVEYDIPPVHVGQGGQISYKPTVFDKRDTDKTAVAESVQELLELINFFHEVKPGKYTTDVAVLKNVVENNQAESLAKILASLLPEYCRELKVVVEKLAKMAKGGQSSSRSPLETLKDWCSEFLRADNNLAEIKTSIRDRIEKSKSQP